MREEFEYLPRPELAAALGAIAKCDGNLHDREAPAAADEFEQNLVATRTKMFSGLRNDDLANREEPTERIVDASYETR